MSITKLDARSNEGSLPFFQVDSPAKITRQPLVSLIVPTYNKTALIENNLLRLCRYMASLESLYRWEIVLVNDGSLDSTGDLAEAFARRHNHVRVFHHI